MRFGFHKENLGEVVEWLKATAPQGAVMRATASEVQILPLSAKFGGIDK